MNPIKQYAPWLTLRRGLLAAYGIVLLSIYLWPDADLIVEIILLATIPGTLATMVWGLTFWQPARVQIGRRQLKYKAVRRVAALIALACLPFLTTRYLSIWVHQPPDRSEEIAQGWQELRARYRFVVAFSHLEGDKGDKLMAQMTEALSKLDPRLSVTAIVVNHRIPTSGQTQGMGHLDALDIASTARANMLIWGKASPEQIGPVYATDASYEEPFAGVYLPADFTLPDLPGENFCDVLQLVVATRSAAVLTDWSFEFGDALQPLIKKVRCMADDLHKTSSWSPEARARIEFVLGVASRISASKVHSHDALQNSTACFENSLRLWTRERNPLEWAMTQANLGRTLRKVFDSEYKQSVLEPALDSFKGALAVYQARSDTLDAAGMEYQSGWILELIGRYTGDPSRLQEAIKAYRSSLAGYDVKIHPGEWAGAQLQMGGALGVLASKTEDGAYRRQAVEALKAALTVFRTEKGSRRWLSTLHQLAINVADLGQLTSNRDYVNQSIAMCQQALADFPRDRNAVTWAVLQMTLANSFLAKGQLESSVVALQTAGAGFQTALSVLNPDSQSTDWAHAKEGLADTFVVLGEQTRNALYLSRAVENYREVLNVYPREEDPEPWAFRKFSLGVALVDLGQTEAGTRHLKESVECFREALTVLTKEKNPVMWQQANDNLKIAREALRLRGASEG
jgi:tetratricopeptide (TPR) repeat protein